MSKNPLKVPKSNDLTPKQIEAPLERVAARRLEEEDWAIIGAMAETIVFLGQAIDNKGVSVRRLLRMIFGVKTESTKNVLPQSEDTTDTGDNSPPTDTDDAITDKKTTPEKRKGHGRKGADTYTGAEKSLSLMPH